MRPLKQKSNGKHVGGSNMPPLNQKVRQKCNPSNRKSTPNAAPESSRTPLGVKIKGDFCDFTLIFSCIWRRAGSDPQAERGRGEVNLSPKGDLTLRPRVGGLVVWVLFRQGVLVVVVVWILMVSLSHSPSRSLPLPPLNSRARNNLHYP